MNESADSAVMQLLIPDEFVDSSLSLKSSCGEECEVAVHVTAEDQLAGMIVNTTNATVFFKPFSDAYHYVVLRLLSGESTNVSLQLVDSSPTYEPGQVKSVDLMRKSLPDFFLFDYEHLRGNGTKPSAFNLTSDTLSVLSFEIGRVYDVGGTLTLGLKLVDAKDKEKKNIVVVACISLGEQPKANYRKTPVLYACFLLYSCFNRLLLEYHCRWRLHSDGKHDGRGHLCELHGTSHHSHSFPGTRNLAHKSESVLRGGKLPLHRDLSERDRLRRL